MDTLMKCLTPSCRCCWQLDAMETLQRVGPPCAETAEKTAASGAEAYDQGLLALQYTRDVGDVLKSFGTINTTISLSTFRNIQQLVEEKKARKALKIASELDNVAGDMLANASDLTDSLQEAVDSLPLHVQEDLGTEQDYDINNRGASTNATRTRDIGGDDDGDAALTLTDLLDHAELDVEEVDVQTRGIEEVNIFTAGVRGRNAFETVAKKESIAIKIFQQIKRVAATIQQLAVAFTTGDCCAQVKAVAAGIRDLFQCLKLGQLLKRALATVKRYLKAFIGFITTAWDKFTGFFEEFDAAKRLGRFTSRVKNSKVATKLKNSKVGKKFKKSKVGKFAKNAVGKFRDRRRGGDDDGSGEEEENDDQGADNETEISSSTTS
jgi:hypothetical protein